MKSSRIFTTVEGEDQGQDYRKTDKKKNDCEINLDDLEGEYPPLFIQNDTFVYPSSSRVLSFGQISKMFTQENS